MTKIIQANDFSPGVNPANPDLQGGLNYRRVRIGGEIAGGSSKIRYILQPYNDKSGKEYHQVPRSLLPSPPLPKELKQNMLNIIGQSKK